MIKVITYSGGSGISGDNFHTPHMFSFSGNLFYDDFLNKIKKKSCSLFYQNPLIKYILDSINNLFVS